MDGTILRRLIHLSQMQVYEHMFVGTSKPRKPLERAAARRLRGKGMPYKKIAAYLGVSPHSVMNWTRDIEITDEQRKANLAHMTPESEIVKKRAATWRSINQQRRLGFQQEGRLKARSEDRFHMSGCMLYWAEGSKDRNSVVLANSDSNMMVFFLRFLRESFGVDADRVSLRLNVYLNNDLTLAEIEEFWLGELDLPRACLRKPMINHFPTSSSGKRGHKLPYGVCTLRVGRSTQLVQHIFGAIQEYGGFEEPRWLDGPPRKPVQRKAKDDTPAE